MTATTEDLKALRTPFPPEKLGKLPKGTLSGEEYKRLPKTHCATCGGYHPATNTIHLDFVGHADVTERLLDVDPEWNWRPMAVAPDGGPALKLNAAGLPYGLWIKLTVGRVTRIGFGSVSPGAFDAEKQLIGDAIRNAAMRFGVALDLWRKEIPDASPQSGARAARQTEPAHQGAAATNGEQQRVTVLSREPVTGEDDRVRFCPDCGSGALELVTWSNHQSAICCTNWRDKDGGCKHREAVADQTPIPF
jgi:hypothetical protein